VNLDTDIIFSSSLTTLLANCNVLLPMTYFDVISVLGMESWIALSA
jgi:hypothetical protein